MSTQDMPVLADNGSKLQDYVLLTIACVCPMLATATSLLAVYVDSKVYVMQQSSSAACTLP